VQRGDPPRQRGRVLPRSRLGATPEHDVQLRQRDRDADAGEHAVHDRRRDRRGVAADAEEPEADLQQPGAHRDHARRLPSEPGHELGDDDRQAGGGPGDLQRRPAEKPGDHTTDDGGDEPGHDRRTGRQRDAERQRDGDEEDDDGGGHIGAQRRPAGTGRAGRRRGQANLRDRCRGRGRAPPECPFNRSKRSSVPSALSDLPWTSPRLIPAPVTTPV